MSQNESHLEKIRKLLRLSKSANVHEAELALKRAMELAARHAVDLSDLAADAEVGGIVHRWFPIKSRLAREWKMSFNIAAAHFQVHPCISYARRSVVFVGRADAIEVADFIVSFLVREVRRQVAAFSRTEKRMTKGKRAGFITGFFHGIHSRLAEGSFDLMREDARYAIVLKSEADKRAAELSKVIGKTTSVALKSPRRSAATLAGFISGQETQINRPLAGRPGRESLNQGALLLK